MADEVRVAHGVAVSITGGISGEHSRARPSRVQATCRGCPRVPAISADGAGKLVPSTSMHMTLKDIATAGDVGGGASEELGQRGRRGVCSGRVRTSGSRTVWLGGICECMVVGAEPISGCSSAAGFGLEGGEDEATGI